MGDFNVILLVIVIVVCIACLLLNIYILINYQHPDDKNQAYFPKAIVIVGLTIAELSILLLPADVANKNACKNSVYNGACKFTLPMDYLWLVIYIVNGALVFFIIPFTIFYYEGDQDRKIMRRVRHAILWVGVIALVMGLLVGIMYGVVGKVDFAVQRLTSATESFSTGFSSLSTTTPCFGSSPTQQISCYAYTSPDSKATWTLTPTFPEYVIGLMTIAASALFSIYGGYGIASLPIGMIFDFIRRPKATITRSQYIKEATDLGKRAKDIKEVAQSLQLEERSGSKGRQWRKSMNIIQQELVHLEEDVKALEQIYPQGEKAHASWALTVIWFFIKFVLGIIGLIVSVCWVMHIILYTLLAPPVSPFLNEIFVKLDKVWGLFGTSAFALFCFYLLLAVMAGQMDLGMKFSFLTPHPMEKGATLMNSFLFNVGLILLCSFSVIQFTATAFAIYAEATSVQELFGNKLESLRGIKYLFRYNVFQVIFILVAVLSFIYNSIVGWRRKKTRKRLRKRIELIK